MGKEIAGKTHVLVKNPTDNTEEVWILLSVCVWNIPLLYPSFSCWVINTGSFRVTYLDLIHTPLDFGILSLSHGSGNWNYYKAIPAPYQAPWWMLGGHHFLILYQYFSCSPPGPFCRLLGLPHTMVAGCQETGRRSSFYRPGPGNWHHVTSIFFCCQAVTKPVFKGNGHSPHLWNGKGVKEFGALFENCHMVEILYSFT